MQCGIMIKDKPWTQDTHVQILCDLEQVIYRLCTCFLL